MAQSYTCVATVATDGGKATLGTTTVTGNPISVAASACHDFTRKAFAANVNWSDPAKVCGRYPSGDVRRVEAIDHFKEVGGPTPRRSSFSAERMRLWARHSCLARQNVWPT